MIPRPVHIDAPRFPNTEIPCEQLADFTAEQLYPRRSFTVTTDAQGQATVLLDADPDGVVPWQLKIGETSYRVHVTSGPEQMDLADLVVDLTRTPAEVDELRADLATSEAALAALQQSQARAVVVGDDLLRDTFNGTVLGGSRHITGDAWIVEDGALTGGVQESPAVWGASRVNWSPDADELVPFERQAGRVYVLPLTLSDFSDDAAFFLSADGGDGDPHTSNAVGWIVESGELALVTPAGKLVIAAGQSNIRTSSYWLILVDLGGEVAVLLQHVDNDLGGGRDDALPLPGVPYVRLPYPPTFLDADALYPVLSALGTGNPTPYPGGHHVSSFRVLDIPEWDRPDALALFSESFDQDDATPVGRGWYPTASTWRRVGGAVVTVTGSGFQLLAIDSGVSDGTFRVFIYVPSGAQRSFGFALRVDNPENPQNYIRIINNASDNIFAQVWSNGGFGYTIPDASGDANWIADAWNELVVFADGPRYRIMVNRIDVAGGWKTDPQGSHLTNTGVALWTGTDSPNGVRWRDLAVYPHEILLPAAITALGGPRPIVVGALLDLPTLTPLVIGQVTLQLGDLGRADAEFSFTLTVPSGNPTIFVGVAFGWDDAGNGYVARVLEDPINQVGAGEFEILRYQGGEMSSVMAAGVERKGQLGPTWGQGPHRVTVQHLDGETRVLRNGVVYLTTRHITTLPGTRWGTSRHAATSAGVTMTGLQARAVYEGVI